MNKGKVVTTIGAILLTTGVIGGAYSGVVAFPKVMNNMQNAESNLNKEEVLYKGQIHLTKLNINAKDSDVKIRKYDGQNVIVERSGDKTVSTITAKVNGNELNITEEAINKNFGKDIDDMVKYLVNQMYLSHQSEITVYVPNDIEINVNTDYGMLNIYDSDINNLNFNTSSGRIALNENCHINNLNIKSDNFIQLQVRELYRLNNLNVECYSFGIYKQGTVSNKSSIPENINIVTSGDFDNVVVDIDSNLPVAKNLKINSNGDVELNLPIQDYKFNFDIKALNGISFDSDNKDKFDKNNFNGVINENPKDNTSDYFVSIKGKSVIFE